MTHDHDEEEACPACVMESKLKVAVASIDGVFGKGHARKNPTLIAACLQSMAGKEIADSLDYVGYEIHSSTHADEEE